MLCLVKKIPFLQGPVPQIFVSLTLEGEYLKMKFLLYCGHMFVVFAISLLSKLKKRDCEMGNMFFFKCPQKIRLLSYLGKF